MRLKRILLICILLLFALPGVSSPAQAAATKITVVGFSDYHSHAVPFYSEGAPDQAGIARAIAYLKAQRQVDPNLVVLDGGDMINKGSPTWSDEYKCIEWPWLNGLVDAMALGNHEFDYGQDVFKNCQAQIKFPILSANYVGADGKPLFLADGKPYLVKEIGGIKLGLFALADLNYGTLIKKENMAPDSSFADRVSTARQIVKTLRETEKVNAVILFGHAYRENDTSLAQAVSGIDLILGTHSHYKGEFSTLPNTKTHFMSPFQYLTYFSRVELTFTDGKISDAQGQLVKMDAAQPADPEIASLVAQKQKDLEAKYPDRFKVLGTAAVELSDANVSTDESVLGNWAAEAVRSVAGTHLFVSTSSSFRAAIPPGPITVETFYTAIPYKNALVTAEMTGQQVAELFDMALARRGSDSFLQESGVRFTPKDGKATGIQILADPTNPVAGYVTLDKAKTYTVATTDFLALVSGYKDLFAKAANVVNTKRDVSTLLTDKIQADGTVTAALDGRMGTPQAK